MVFILDINLWSHLCKSTVYLHEFIQMHSDTCVYSAYVLYVKTGGTRKHKGKKRGVKTLSHVPCGWSILKDVANRRKGSSPFRDSTQTTVGRPEECYLVRIIVAQTVAVAPFDGGVPAFRAKIIAMERRVEGCVRARQRAVLSAEV